jgi:hypothetical protein
MRTIRQNNEEKSQEEKHKEQIKLSQRQSRDEYNAKHVMENYEKGKRE